MNLTDRIASRIIKELSAYVSDCTPRRRIATIITEELARDGGELEETCRQLGIEISSAGIPGYVAIGSMILTSLTPLFAKGKEENARLTKACEGEFASVEELNNETLRLRADKERLESKLSDLITDNNELTQSYTLLNGEMVALGVERDQLRQQLQSLTERNGEMERALKNIYGRTFGGSSIRWPNARIAEECSKVLTPQPANEGKELSSGVTKTEPLCAECKNPISEHTLDSTPTCPVYYKDQQQAGAVCPHGKKVSPDDFCGQCWKDYVKGKEPHA